MLNLKLWKEAWPKKNELDDSEKYEKRVTSLTKHMTETRFGAWMSHFFIPKYDNNVMSFVYFGAALLVIVLGLRGLGESAVNYIPNSIIEETDGFMHLSTTVVLGALILEFVLISIMAIVMFFKPEDNDKTNVIEHSSERLNDFNILFSLETVSEFLKKEDNNCQNGSKKDNLTKSITVLDEYINIANNLLPKKEDSEKKISSSFEGSPDNTN